MATDITPGSVDTNRPPASLLVRGAHVVTQDERRSILKTHDVYCEDGRIVEVAPDVATEADIVVEAAGRVLLPGLVNAHTHLAMGLFRGYGDDMLLEPWLQERIWPAEARLTEETMRAGADLGLLEMIRSGTTSFLDMYFMEPLLAEATAAAGMRGWMGWGLVDVGSTAEGDVHERLKGPFQAFAEDWADHDLITPSVAPHATYTCNPETLEKSAELAAHYDIPLHIHCAETRQEVYDVEAKTGRRPVAQLAATGALGERTVLAHCGWITKQEVQDIARAGAKVAHNPTSNLKLATGGVTPLPELFAAGATVALGTDGPASNNACSLFEAMKLAALVQKQQRWDPTILPAGEALDLATRGGAAALRRPDLGTLEEGKTADLTLVDFRRPHLVPCHDVVSNIVYAAQMADVTHTIVAGRVLYGDGVFTTLDVPSVLSRAEEAARQVCQPVVEA
ncbi:MAG: amidohydrolase [Euryarchaeota archaeon]|nr:amidohydrolase [Euryarchaeota archaeon]